MSVIETKDDRLIVHFAWWERLLVRRGTEEVPLDSVTGAEAREQWWYRPMGVRAGLVVSGFLKVGTWRSPGNSRLVCIRRGLPTLRIAIDKGHSGGRFDELLIGTKDAHATAEALSARVSGRG